VYERPKAVSGGFVPPEWRQVSHVCGSSKRQQPHRPQVSEIARYQQSDLLEWPLLTFLPLVHTEEVTTTLADDYLETR
jgi:hypothetical protein